VRAKGEARVIGALIPVSRSKIEDNEGLPFVRIGLSCSRSLSTLSAPLLSPVSRWGPRVAGGDRYTEASSITAVSV